MADILPETSTISEYGPLFTHRRDSKIVFNKGKQIFPKTRKLNSSSFLVIQSFLCSTIPWEEKEKKTFVFFFHIRDFSNSKTPL